ncbi:MAG TPA: hypothetical protein VMA75_05060 [Candidatus Paceibacterota bacterium]|nr:hypothetical protein [Candidatus Paceibacterota bacterium]
MIPRPITFSAVFAGIFIFLSALIFSPHAAHAQTASSPQFLVTWQASGDHVPAFYQGKLLPSYESKVTASLELVSPSGKLINLQSQPIYWYVDQVAVGGGVGVQQVTFTPFGTPPSSLDLTVSLPQYSSGYLSDDLEIPFVDPVAIIDAPYPNQEFSTNPLTVTALPFFFAATSTSDLSFTWAVNGQTGGNAENPQVANISLPQGTAGGTSIDVSLSIENPVGSTVATADRSLTYQNEL